MSLSHGEQRLLEISRKGSMRALSIGRVLVVCGALAGAHVNADGHVTAHGLWYCWDSSVRPGGKVVPLEGARVELVDSDCLGSEICDDVMGTSHVRADGSYQVEGSGGDPGIWWTEPDVYVRVVFNDDEGVREADDLDITRSASSPQHDHDNTHGDIDFGSLVTGLGVSIGDGNKCGVWLAARKAYRAYLQTVGSAPPAGYYDITYYSALYGISPWSDRDTTHYPTHFPLNPFAPDPSDPTPSKFAINTPAYVIDHEFGHTLRHAADGDRDHFNWDNTRFRYGREHDHCNSGNLPEQDSDREAAAFNEGWAAYWGGSIVPCNNPLNWQVEGDVAAALSLLATCPGVGRAGLMNVLIDNPYAIHAYREFRAKYDAMFPTCAIDTSAPGTQTQQQLVKVGNLAHLTSRVRSSAALAEHAKAIELLRSRVGAQVRKQSRCRSDRACAVAAEQTVHLAMLTAAKALVQREREQLERTDVAASSPCRECELQQARHERFAAARNAYMQAFDQALAGIEKLPRNEATRVAAAELRAKRERFRTSVQSGRLMPMDSQLDDALLGERVERRERTSLAELAR